MMHTRFFVAVLLPLTSLASPVHSQSPLNAHASVPAVRYTSSLSTYRPVLELSVGSWREANERVGRIGGWRVYQREALSPPSAASAPAP
jgi:hypothetical protein